MKNHFHFLCALLLFTLLMGCTKTTTPGEEEKKCGGQTSWASNNIELVNTASDGVIREMFFEDLNRPEDICTEGEHPRVEFTYSFKEEPPTDLQCHAKAYWSIYKREQQMSWDPAKKAYVARMEPGLNDAFQGEKGYLNMQIVVKFATKGGHEQDSAYLASISKSGISGSADIRANYAVSLK